MIINISKEWKEFAHTQFKNSFESINKDDDTDAFIKRILMKTEPWNDNTDEIISKMIEDRHDLIKELFGVIIKAQGVVL